MKKLIIVAAGAGLVFLLWPAQGLAISPKTFSGKVTNINGSYITFTTVSAAYYNAQTQNVSLVRRYGAPMQISEMLVGDKVQVNGFLRPDNSIAASKILDASLYTHTGTVSGKILIINPLLRNFTMINSQRQALTIQTDGASGITKNGIYATLDDLSTGMTVSVKGTWERSSLNVRALTIKATLRMVNIYVTGTLVVRGQDFISIVGSNGAMYGVDIDHAELQNKGGKPIVINQFLMDDKVRVWGKHISGVAEIVASKIKDSSR